MRDTIYEFWLSHTKGTKISRPFEVVVLQPHVGVFGIPFSHDGVPQFSGFLHVLTVKGLIEKIQVTDCFPI